MLEKLSLLLKNEMAEKAKDLNLKATSNKHAQSNLNAEFYI